MKYDVVIAYRIYPQVSRKPVLFSTDKYKLSKLCLDSLCDSLTGLNVKLIAILDNCPDEYQVLFEERFPNLEVVKVGGIGNFQTFNLQIKLLTEQKDCEYVYFAEDDYFYLENQFRYMLDFIKSNKEVHFISPYDHLDYYTMDLHNQKRNVVFHSNKYWQTSNSTCLTFLTTKTILNQSKSTFLSYAKGCWDVSLWRSITKTEPCKAYKMIGKDRFLAEVYKQVYYYNLKQILFGKKYNLFTPIPAIATHMEEIFLAPYVDWKTEFNKYLSTE